LYDGATTLSVRNAYLLDYGLVIVRRKATLKAHWILLASAVLVVATGWIWVKSLEHRRWKHLEQRVAALGREADLRFCPRPVLRGAAVPGNAWEDYLPAIDLVAKMGARDSAIGMYAVSSHDPDYDRIREVVNEYSPAVDLMQRGTRRADSHRPRLHEMGDPEVGWLSSTMVLANLAACRARLLAREEKTREATELVLDLCKYAEDVAGDGSNTALILYYNMFYTPLAGLEYLLTHARLSPEDCRQIERELGELDATFPRLGPVLQHRLEYFGSWILSGGRLADLRGVGCILAGMEIQPGWQEAFSMPLLQVAGFDQTDGFTTRLLRADEGTAAMETARWKEVYAERERARNPYFLIFTHSDGMPSPGSLRDLRTRLRLSRAAAHYKATGEFLALDDPLGTKLFHQVEPDEVRFWGVGEGGGVDVNGAGIVLRISRRPCPSCSTP
jgi:hypothetical protein